MDFGHYTYFILDLFTLSLPLALSFDKKVHYFRRWKYLAPAIAAPAIPFLIWDHFFTEAGIWGFSPEYILGIYIGGKLPLEEVLFFFVVPYACVFIYDCANRYIPTAYRKHKVGGVTYSLMAFLLIWGLFYFDHLYTSITFFSLAAALFLNFKYMPVNHLGQIYRAWLICLAPFAFVNGALTALPVVWYDDAQNLGFRLGSIPFEDIFYGMLLFVLNITVYDYLRHKNNDVWQR